MQVYDKNRGIASQILDYKYMEIALNGILENTLHLRVEWVSHYAELSYSWEPITRIYRDVPVMVTNYCQKTKLDIQDVIEKEADKRKPFYWEKFDKDKDSRYFKRKSPNRY